MLHAVWYTSARRIGCQRKLQSDCLIFDLMAAKSAHLSRDQHWPVPWILCRIWGSLKPEKSVRHAHVLLTSPLRTSYCIGVHHNLSPAWTFLQPWYFPPATCIRPKFVLFRVVLGLFLFHFHKMVVWKKLELSDLRVRFLELLLWWLTF